MQLTPTLILQRHPYIEPECVVVKPCPLENSILDIHFFIAAINRWMSRIWRGVCYDIGTMKRLGFWVSFLVLAVSAPAADYVMKTVPVRAIESYPARATVAGATIAADPYPNDEKSYTAFDIKDLNSRGYYPVHIIIHNGTAGFLNIRTRNIILITSAGEQVYTTPGAIVVDDVTRAGLSARIPLMGSRAAGGSPLADFTGKELINASMAPGSITDGFLFFSNPNLKKNLFEGSTLYIPKLEEEGTRKPVGPFTIYLDRAASETPDPEGKK